MRHSLRARVAHPRIVSVKQRVDAQIRARHKFQMNDAFCPMLNARNQSARKTQRVWIHLFHFQKYVVCSCLEHPEGGGVSGDAIRYCWWYSSCRRKIRYSHASHAHRHIQTIVEFGEGFNIGDLVSYRCLYCQGWHIGHQRRGRELR